MRESLGVAGLDHQSARAEFIAASGPKSRGQAVIKVLKLLSEGGWLYKLLAAGEPGGLWGLPWIFDPVVNRNVSARFAQANRSPP